MPRYLLRIAMSRHQARVVTVSIVCWALGLLPTGAHAQSVLNRLVRVGSHVRVATVNPDPVIGLTRTQGVVESVERDRMTVTWESGLQSTLTSKDIAALYESRGTRRYPIHGMGIGLLGGAIAGRVHGHNTYEGQLFGRSLRAASHAVVGGLTGMVVGGVVGATVRRERWSRLPLDPEDQRASIAPIIGADLRGVRVSVRF